MEKKLRRSLLFHFLSPLLQSQCSLLFQFYFPSFFSIGLLFLSSPILFFVLLKKICDLPTSQIPFRSSYTFKISLFLSNVKQLRSPILRDSHLIDPPLSSSSSPNGARIKGGRPPQKPQSSKENASPSDQFLIPNPKEPASTQATLF